ncbi:MAG TPA: GtrA family protein [Candidatus Micrarchaeia archaeon]|nr:GtrA family protein [Candidatus Micrarchaeia archaeon]
MLPPTTSRLPEPTLRIGAPADRTGRRVPRTHPTRLAAFVTAGLLGLGTQLGATALLYGRLHLPLWLGSGLAIQTAILVTFTVNSRITWRDRAGGSAGPRRFLTFEAVSLVGLGLNEAVLLTAATVLGLHYLVASLCGAASASLWNYLANDRVTFRAAARRGVTGSPPPPG